MRMYSSLSSTYSGRVLPSMSATSSRFSRSASTLFFERLRVMYGLTISFKARSDGSERHFAHSFIERVRVTSVASAIISAMRSRYISTTLVVGASSLINLPYMPTYHWMKPMVPESTSTSTLKPERKSCLSVRISSLSVLSLRVSLGEPITTVLSSWRSSCTSLSSGHPLKYTTGDAPTFPSNSRQEVVRRILSLSLS